MSTKRMSKTVIEGGRGRHNKFERYQSNAEVRAAKRDYIKEVMVDPEYAYEDEIPERRAVYKDFRDKLRPIYRWLDSKVGRRWDEVRSEVFEAFDTRTTAGRHILFDHLLKEVVDSESGFDDRGRMANPEIPVIHLKKQNYYWSFADYYVDEEGILCAREDRHRRRYRYQPEATPTEQEYKDTEAWLQNRMVIEKDGKLYWAVSTEGIWLGTFFEPNRVYDRWSQHELYYYVRDSGEHEEIYWRPDVFYHDRQVSYKVKTCGTYWKKMDQPYSFRQRGELNAQDIKTFRSFKSRIRRLILAYSKGR